MVGLDGRFAAVPPVALLPPPLSAEEIETDLGLALWCGAAGAGRLHYPLPPGSITGRDGGTGELGSGGTDEDDADEGGAYTGLSPFEAGSGHDSGSHAYADTSPTPMAPTPYATTVREAAAAPNPAPASSGEDGQGDDQDAHRAARAMRPTAAPPAATPATPAAQAPTLRPPPLSAE